MLNNNYAEKLIGIKDAILLNIENIQDTIIIEFKMEKRIHECPSCKTHTSKVHDYRIQWEYPKNHFLFIVCSTPTIDIEPKNATQS